MFPFQVKSVKNYTTPIRFNKSTMFPVFGNLGNGLNRGQLSALNFKILNQEFNVKSGDPDQNICYPGLRAGTLD